LILTFLSRAQYYFILHIHTLFVAIFASTHHRYHHQIQFGAIISCGERGCKRKRRNKRKELVNDKWIFEAPCRKLKLEYCSSSFTSSAIATSLKRKLWFDKKCLEENIDL
jgi:hypothetical protein